MSNVIIGGIWDDNDTILIKTEVIKKIIAFTVIYLDEAYSIQTYPGEYRNLMVLLNERMYLEDFGECKGIGRCGTCVTEIEGLNETLLQKQRNETVTLGKMGISQPSIRLACQILINEDLQNATIRIGV